MTNSPNNIHFLPELAAATGKFDFPMTNDYMFRAVLQSNNKALTGLISSLLHIPLEDISSVVVTNPIILGDACQDKEMRLDINVALNNHSLINLDYSDFRFIPINLFKDCFNKLSQQFYRNNCFNNPV